MLEKFKPKNIKDRTKSFLREHKQEILKELPAAATIISLGIAGAKKDTRLGAITGAIYIGYDKTKDAIADTLEQRRKDKLLAPLPTGIQDEVKMKGLDNLLNTEYDKFLENSNIREFITREAHSMYESKSLKIITVDHTDDSSKNQEYISEGVREGSILEDPTQSGLIEKDMMECPHIEIQNEDFENFMDGVTSAHYLLRLINDHPIDFSEERLRTHNSELASKAEHYKGGLYQYLAKEVQKEIKDRTLLEHVQALISYGSDSGEDQQMAINGGLYILSLYENQLELEKLQRQIDSPYYRKQKTDARSSPDVLPEQIKNALNEHGLQTVIEKELEFANGKPPLMEDTLVYIEDDYEPGSTYISEISIGKEKQVNKDEPAEGQSKKIHALALYPEDLPDFLKGILCAHYLLRTKDNAKPEISVEVADGYNASLVKRNDNKENVHKYLTQHGEEIIKDKDLLNQLEAILELTKHRNQLIFNGAIYMIGLYERQKEIDALEKSFTPDPPNS